jgi:hypothetical protein
MSGARLCERAGREKNTMNKHITDAQFLQAYQDSISDRINLHWEKNHVSGNYIVRHTYGESRGQKGTHELKMVFQGKYLEARVKYQTERDIKRSKRSTITDFSAGSRRRMFDLFHRLDICTKPIFLTLTYGDDYPDAKTAKNHLRALLERFRRAYKSKGTSAIWRMEFQERGAPHFHIMLFELPYVAKDKIQQMWSEIVGQNNLFTRIEQVRSHKQVMSYVSKYIAKVNPDGADSGFNSLSYLHAYRAKYGDNIGRVWGVFERDNLPFAERIEIALPFNKARFERFKAYAAQKYPPIADYQSDGFRLYVRDARQWENLFHTIYDIPFHANC